MRAAATLLGKATARRLSLPDRGVEIALLDWGGEGPPALFHHANGFCKGIWAQVAAGLCGHFRVVAMDARGHGDSRFLSEEPSFGWEVFARDVVAVAEALCDEFGVSGLGLGVGHSFGGTSILGAAALRPELFEGLVVLDPVTPPPAAGRDSPGSELARRARKRRCEWPSREEARAWLAERELFSSWDPVALDLYLLDGLRPAARGGVELKCPPWVEAAVFSGDRLDLAAWLERVEATCLWVWAERGSFPRALQEGLAAGMRRSQFRVAHTGHLLPMEAPRWVADAILDFATAQGLGGEVGGGRGALVGSSADS